MLPGVGVDGVLIDGEGLLPPTPLLLAPPLVLLRAIAAKVSNRPPGFDCSMVLELAADVRLGTLTLIEDGPRLPFSFCSLFSRSLSFLPKIHNVIEVLTCGFTRW